MGRLGQRVAAPSISLSDSPRFPRTLPRAFDLEGVPKAPLPLIQDGVAHRVVHDTRSAARAGGGARTTGHATAPGGAGLGPHPTNLVLIGGGAADEAELAAPIERGLYVTRFWYVNIVHEKQTLLTGMTRDGTFLIEDGRITRPVRDVRFTDSVLRILEATEALTATPRLVAEADFYGRRFATGVGLPRAAGARLPDHGRDGRGLIGGALVPGRLEQDDRVHAERDREADRPAVQVALDERAATERPLPGPDAEGAREAGVLPGVHEHEEDQDDRDDHLDDGEEQLHGGGL